MSEPESGSDAFSLRTTAEKKDGRYVLNGTKMFITNAAIADSVLVFATMDRNKGINGITAFMVDKGTPGLTVSRKLDKMGLRTSPMGEVVFEDCEIPEEQSRGQRRLWRRDIQLRDGVGARRHSGQLFGNHGAAD